MMRTQSIVQFVFATCLAGTAIAQPAEPETAPPTVAEATPPPATETLDQRLRSLLGRPGGLTAEEVGRRAVKNSLDVRAKQAELSAASAEVDRAFVAWFPRLTLTARYVHLSPIDAPTFGPGQGNLVATTAGEGPLPPGSPLIGVPASALSFPVITDQYSLQAGLLVPVSDYLLRISRAEQAAADGRDAATLGTRAARLNAGADAKLVYYSWVRARLQQVVAEQGLTQAKSHLEAVKAAREVDRLSQADQLRAESAVASAELMVERASNLTKMGEDRLRTLLRDPPERGYSIGEDPMRRDTAPRERRDFSALYREALAHRVELRALDKTARSLEKQRQAVASAAYPRLDAFGNAYYANPNSRYVPQQKEWHATWDVGLQVTWTPHDVGTTAASKSSLEAQRAKVHAQRAQLADALRAEVFDALQAVREAEVAVDTSARGLQAAEAAYEARAEQFRFGRTSLLELTDAETDMLRARLEVVNARVGLSVARVKLDHAIGRDTASP
jgi:outer membrane protein